MTDDEKVLHVSMAVGSLETVRAREFDENPKSRRARVLGDLLGRCLLVTDMYRMDAWEPEKLNKAWDVLAETEKRIKEVFWEPNTMAIAEQFMQDICEVPEI